MDCRYSMYDEGRGVARDPAKAAEWWRKAAEQGDAAAQLNLGVMYASGIGVSQNHSQAVHWWRQAAEQGEANAQFNLALSYRDGRGVSRDYLEAVVWLTLASSGLSGADHQKCIAMRDGLANDLSPTQLAEAMKKAREWAEAFEQTKP